MRKHILDALLSVKEVAAFAWSLFELLLTRILPLSGFLAGHLLLQLCGFLASVAIAAAGEEEELTEENRAWVVKEGGDLSNEAESLKRTDKLQQRQHVLREEDLISGASLNHGEDADVEDTSMSAAAAAITNANWSESVPFDAVTKVVSPRGVDFGLVAHEREGLDVGTNEGQRHASAASPSEEALDVQSRSRSWRRIRVLPPSLSQVKRTLIQRSRRASASPASQSPCSAPSGPMKKRPHTIVPRTAVKSPSNNFMRKFKKHFMLDPH